MDLTALADEELDALRVDVLNEQERRRGVAVLPAEIERLSAKLFAAARLEEPPVDAAIRGVETAKAAVSE